MSGICGQFNLDSAPVAEADLHAMTAMLERRGPDRSNIWHQGTCGFGHTLLATTPELLYEQQPFMHAESGCVITADVRLDNREELLGALGLSERRDSIGDAELILRCYLEWSDACLDRLLGDFSFAINDPRHQKMLCARDHFGLRPLYYHHAPRRRFLFASDARAILVLPEVPYKINEARIADVLVSELQWIDYTSTFYEGVHRLPPGHRIVVTPAGIDVVEYWTPQPGPDLGQPSDDDYVQGFLEVFTQAVQSRLRTPTGVVGSMLSGGMDSGSVVAIAQEILSADGRSLQTFSAVRRPDDGEIDCAESDAIRAAIRMPSISPTLIHPESADQNFEQLVSGHEEPFDGEFMILKAIYLAARKEDTRVVLDGGAGDVVLAEGSYVARLIRTGRIKRAMAEIAAAPRFWQGGSITSGLLHHGRIALVPEAVKRRLRPLKYRRDLEGYLDSSLISRDFATRVGIGDRFERMRQTFGGNWTADFALERSNAIRPNLAAGRERYARIAASTGTEARDPFLDKRVVDYCSRLPGRFRLKDGWPKMILRDLMANKLPDEVLWCRGKPHLGWFFNESVSKVALHRGDLNASDLGETLGNYVDSTALANAWEEFVGGGNAGPIDSAYHLSVWLQESKQRPVVPQREIG